VSLEHDLLVLGHTLHLIKPMREPTNFCTKSIDRPLVYTYHPKNPHEFRLDHEMLLLSLVLHLLQTRFLSVEILAL
jgi:hypothetical protein